MARGRKFLYGGLIMKKKVFSVIFVIFITVSVLFVIVSCTNNDNDDKHNYSNDRQYGYVAAQGDWVYFNNAYNDWQFYKMKQDGTEKTLLSTDNVRNIHIIGDWIYYINDSEPYSPYSVPCKMKTDGTEVTYIGWTELPFSETHIVGDWIYYMTFGYELCKMKIDGTEQTKLSFLNSYTCLNIIDDWIYYTGADNWVYKIRTDGTDITKIIPEIWGNNLHIADSWIYYTGSNSINKVRIDDTEHIEIYLGFQPLVLNIPDDGWIYFIETDNNEEPKYNICKIRTDGTEKTELFPYNRSTGNIFFLNVVGDWFYFREGEYYEYGYLYRVKKDGSIVENISGSAVERIYVK
jgi:hypothetical protein